jgi:hypothetical protein
MTTTDGTRPARRWGRSVLAVVAGLAAIVALSMLADELAYALGIFPRPPKITYDTGPYLIATAYRAAFGVAGSWIAARLAPGHPMRHALSVGGVGLILCAAGVVAAFSMDMGPRWYPIALFVVTMPCAWLGGSLYRGKTA